MDAFITDLKEHTHPQRNFLLRFVKINSWHVWTTDQLDFKQHVLCTRTRRDSFRPPVSITGRKPMAPMTTPTEDAEMSIIRILLIACLQLGLSTAQGCFTLIVVPYETDKLFSQAALMLAVTIATSSIFTLLNPVIGFYSDRCSSSWGRRRPYMVLGCVIAIFGILGCWICSYHNLAISFGFAGCFVIFQIGCIITGASYTPLLPDLVPASKRGIASAIWGIFQLLGAGVGFSIVGLICPIKKTAVGYLVMAAALAVSAVVTLFIATENQLTDSTKCVLEREAPDLKSSMKQMLSGLKYRDFSLALISRACYFMSTAPASYLQYLIRDLYDASDPERYMTYLVLISLGSSVFVGVLSGKLSDRFGRKIFIYLSSILSVLASFMFALGSTLEIFYVCAVFFGMSNGMYLPVEMALGLDCLPPDAVQKENTESTSLINDHQNENQSTESTPTDKSMSAGRNMGLWSVTQSVGNILGPYIVGPLLQFVGHTDDKHHYTRTGYVVVFTLGSCFIIASSVAVFFIKTDRKNKAQQITSVNADKV